MRQVIHTLPGDEKKIIYKKNRDMSLTSAPVATSSVTPDITPKV